MRYLTIFIISFAIMTVEGQLMAQDKELADIGNKDKIISYEEIEKQKEKERKALIKKLEADRKLNYKRQSPDVRKRMKANLKKSKKYKGHPRKNWFESLTWSRNDHYKMIRKKLKQMNANKESKK